MQAADGALGRLEAEHAQTLAKIIGNGAAGLPGQPLSTCSRLRPATNGRSGAALGDDLEASADAGAPIYWAEVAAADDPTLPDGATPLSRFVIGSPLLRRRLDQIGLVDKLDGPRLAHQLKAGQLARHAMANSGAGMASLPPPTRRARAAERLARKNRLADDSTRKSRSGAASGRTQGRPSTNWPPCSSKPGRPSGKSATSGGGRSIPSGAAQAEVDRAQNAIGELISSRRSALEEARVRLASSLGEAQAMEADARSALAEAGDETAAAAGLVASAQTALTAARERAEQVRLRLGAFETAARLQGERPTPAGADRRRCRQLAATAGGRSSATGDALAARRAEIGAELETLAAAPARFLERRAALDEQIEAARADHQDRDGCPG